MPFRLNLGWNSHKTSSNRISNGYVSFAGLYIFPSYDLSDADFEKKISFWLPTLQYISLLGQEKSGNPVDPPHTLIHLLQQQLGDDQEYSHQTHR